MTKKDLESYQANKRLIERNKKKIEEERLKDLPAYEGKVKGSSKEFPYTERRFSAYMNDPVEEQKSVKKIRQLQEEMKKAEEKCLEVENFIRGIKDVRIKEIFTYRFLDGAKITDTAKKIGYSHSRISQIISKFLKD